MAGFGQKGGLGKAQVLLEVADPVIFGEGDAPGVRLLLPGQDPEEGGFTMAVPADESDPFARVD